MMGRDDRGVVKVTAGIIASARNTSVSTAGGTALTAIIGSSQWVPWMRSPPGGAVTIRSDRGMGEARRATVSALAGGPGISTESGILPIEATTRVSGRLSRGIENLPNRLLVLEILLRRSDTRASGIGDPASAAITRPVRNTCAGNGPAIPPSAARITNVRQVLIGVSQ